MQLFDRKKKESLFSSGTRSSKEGQKRLTSDGAVRDPFDPCSLTDAVASHMPEYIAPMKPSSSDNVFDSSAFIYELKWEGFRTISVIRDNNVKLYSAKKEDRTNVFSQVSNELRVVDYSVILDGEIVALDMDGRHHPNYLTKYPQNDEGTLVYFIFDLLYLDGYSLLSVPLIDRKKLLRRVIQWNDRIKFNDHIEEKGRRFYELAKEQGEKGIIAKAKNSAYIPGERASSWICVNTSSCI